MKTYEFQSESFAESFKKRAEAARGYSLSMYKRQLGEEETYVVADEHYDA